MRTSTTRTICVGAANTYLSDNIITDVYYHPFTSAMHEVAKDFKLSVKELGHFVKGSEDSV